MPPASQQPVARKKIPVLILLSTSVFVVTVIAVLYEVTWFLSFTHDLKTAYLTGTAKILSVIVIISLLWIKSPKLYVWLLLTTLEVILLGLCMFISTTPLDDALTIVALFLALWYYKNLSEKQTVG